MNHTTRFSSHFFSFLLQSPRLLSSFHSHFIPCYSKYSHHFDSNTFTFTFPADNITQSDLEQITYLISVSAMFSHGDAPFCSVCVRVTSAAEDQWVVCFVKWGWNCQDSILTWYAHHSIKDIKRRERELSSLGLYLVDNATLFLGDINTWTWPSRLGEPRIWDSKIWSWVPRDSDLRITALARTSSNCKRQTHPLARKDVTWGPLPQEFSWKKKSLVVSLKGLMPRRTDWWETANRKVTLILT
jgi:hypothetical protein